MGIRILIIQKRFHPNSIAIVRGLRRRGHTVAMLVHGKGSVTEDYSDVDPVQVPYGRFSSRLLQTLAGSHIRNRYALPSFLGLWRELRSFQPDLVILKKGRLSNVIASTMAGLLGGKRILLANNPAAVRGKWWRVGLTAVGILPSVRVTTSAHRPGALEEEKVAGAWYRPYPIELPESGRSLRQQGEPLRLLMVGKFNSARKRLDWLLRAAHQAGLEPGSTRLTLVGTGREGGSEVPALRALADSLGWSASLKFHFNVPQAEMGAFYRKHDIFVMTARDEPFGMVVVEAMAHGLAVLSGDTVGASDCITHERNGLVYASDDLDQLAGQLRRLADSPDLLERLGAEARDTIAMQCTPEAFAEFIEGLVR